MIEEYKTIEIEELEVWGCYVKCYFLDVLKGETTLEEARENILSFRNSEYYTGTKEDLKIIKED